MIGKIGDVEVKRERKCAKAEGSCDLASGVEVMAGMMVASIQVRAAEIYPNI